MHNLMRVPEYNALWFAEMRGAAELAEAGRLARHGDHPPRAAVDAAMKEDPWKPHSNNSYEGKAGEMLKFARARLTFVKCALVSGDRACGG